MRWDGAEVQSIVLGRRRDVIQRAVNCAEVKGDEDELGEPEQQHPIRLKPLALPRHGLHRVERCAGPGLCSFGCLRTHSTVYKLQPTASWICKGLSLEKTLLHLSCALNQT